MAQEWSGQTGGTHWMQRALVHWVRHTDIRIMYAVTNLWLVWYMLVRSTERHGAYLFHRRRGRTRLQAACDVYRSFYHFAKAIIDRFAVYAGKSFEVTVENKERYYDKVHDPEGFVMLFSHVGNTEMAAYFLATPDKRMHILTFGGESPEVMSRRAEAMAQNNIGTIIVEPETMSHIYRINEVLQQGEVLTMAADRRMGGAEIGCRFMDAEARFPSGPFRICQAIKKPVLLTFVIKESYRSYRVYTEELAPTEDLAQRFAERVEQMALAHPYEWFNFYDFWKGEIKN